MLAGVPPFIPSWDDPDDLKWGLFPFALFRGVASLIIGHDPVLERQRRKLAKESRENYERLSPVEHEVFEHLHQEHLRRADGSEATVRDGPNEGDEASK
jgi:hypothetical protein